LAGAAYRVLTLATEPAGIGGAAEPRLELVSCADGATLLASLRSALRDEAPFEAVVLGPSSGAVAPIVPAILAADPHLASSSAARPMAARERAPCVLPEA